MARGVSRGYPARVGTSGRDGRPRAPGRKSDGGSGGAFPPDPLADALLTGAQRAYLDMAAGASRACPGWDITWDLEGFRASDGQVSLGPVSSPSAIVTLVRDTQ